MPSVYELPKQHLQILDYVQNQLIHHFPEDMSFSDSEQTNHYFKTFALHSITDFLKHQQLHLPSETIHSLAETFSRYSSGFGILETILQDPHIQDIYINAPATRNPLHLVVNGEEYTSNIILSEKDVTSFISRLRSISGRPFSEASPVLDMDLPAFHTRIAAIGPPLTPNGTALALRRHREQPWTLVHFIHNNMLSAETAGLLSFLIDGQASLLIAGSRGAGKTSLLTSLLFEIPQRYRILTLEDTQELPISFLQHQHYKIQSLVTKPITLTSSTDIDPTDALRTALRLGESVLILGEVRGIEAKALFEAMRIGAAGNLIMGTIHGSTVQDVYERIVYDIGIPPTSFHAVDGIVIAAPIRTEGGIKRKRRLTQISELKNTGISSKTENQNFTDLYTYQPTKDTLLASEVMKKQNSQLIKKIAKKWGMQTKKAYENINLRSKIKKKLADTAKTYPQLLEAESTIAANNAYWTLLEQSLQNTRTKQALDYDFIWDQWTNWFDEYIKRF